MLQLLPVLLGSTLAGILLRRSGGDVGQIAEVVTSIGWHPENVRVGMLFSETAHRVGILPIIIERIKTPLPKAHKSNAIVRAQNIDKEATSTTIASQKSFGVLWSNGDGMDGWD